MLVSRASCDSSVLDVHGTGELSREQFHRSMLELDATFDEVKLERIFAACDPTKTGLLRYRTALGHLITLRSTFSSGGFCACLSALEKS